MLEENYQCDVENCPYTVWAATREIYEDDETVITYYCWYHVPEWMKTRPEWKTLTSKFN